MRKERNITYVILSLSLVSVLAWFINSIPPTAWWAFVAFFLLVASAVFTFVFFLSNRIRLSLLATLGVIALLLLRAFHLRNPLYAISLLVILLFTGVYLKHKKI